MPYIDDFLNSITMYRLVLWGLAALAALAVALGFFGLIAYSGLGLLLSAAVLFCACWSANYLFALLLNAPRNSESAYITGLILFFVLAPVAGASDVWWLALAGAIAMASKYVLAIRKKHIFNPAAVSAVILSLLGSTAAIWWIGTPAMLPGALVLGLLVVRKIRRFDLFWSFIVAAVIASSIYDWSIGTAIPGALLQMVMSWPLVFFAAIMLTEPLTTPPARPMRLAYGALVGILFALPFHFGIVYASPALALVLGNIFSYAVSPKQKIFLRFASKTQLSANVYEFAFTQSGALAFVPGQYLEWTLPHRKPDTRGNRRYFTIASAPQDREIKLGVRVSERSSSFKKALMELHEGVVLSATALAGEFTLPKEASRKLVFMAGGVGITPFASMLRHLMAGGEKRDIVLVYAASNEKDFAYHDLIDAAQAKLGLRAVYVAGTMVTEDLVRKEVPDYAERMFYLSGPNAMVRAYRRMLLGLSVHRGRIKTDYFPGF